MNLLEFPKTLTIGGIEYETNLEDALSVQESDLNYEFSRHAKLFAYYSTGYELAVHEVSKQKLYVERLCAHLGHSGRVEAKAAGIKFTDAMAEAFVKGHADYLKENEKLLEFQRVMGLLKHAKDAIVHKRDMLKELGPAQRQERGADLMMKADHVKRTIL